MIREAFNQYIKPAIRFFLGWFRVYTAAVRMILEPLFAVNGFRGTGLTLNQAKEILVIKLDRLGDLVLGSAFLRELRANAGRAKISLVVRVEMAELFETCPYVDEVLQWPTDERWLSQHLRSRVGKLCFSLIRMLRFCAKNLWHHRYDMAFIARYDADHYGAFMLAYLSGAAQRVGFPSNNWSGLARTPELDRLLTHPIDLNPEVHESQKLLRVLEAVGGRIGGRHLELWLNEEDRQGADKLLRDPDVSEKVLLIAISPGAGQPHKQWPVHRFAELGRQLLHRSSVRILVVGDGNDGALGEYISRELGKRAHNLCGRTSLRQLAAIIERCSLFVGNDSGPMHLASAAGVPVVEVCCASANGSSADPLSPQRFGPWQVPNVVVRPTASRYPCNGVCTAPEPHCILEISTEMTFSAVRSLVPNWGL